jgi:hypothetical protein
MIRGVIYLLIGTYLYVLTPINQLSKIPKLVSHYQLHASEEKDCSVFSFLAEHYWNQGANHDNDQSEDQRLPFKKYEVILPLVVALVPNHQPFVLKLPEPLSSRIEPIDEHFPNQLWDQSFFQPPCVV